MFALIGGIGCIVMAVLIVFIILSVRRHSAKYYTNEDKRNGEFFIQRLLAIRGRKFSLTLFNFLR